MGVVRLGKLALRWCEKCNVPVLESGKCGKCKGETHEVKLTPPGDVRPAFSCDIELVRDIIDSQFGSGCGKILVPDNKIVILNKAPSQDRMDEVILDGQVLGTLRFDPGFGYRFLPRMHAARQVEDRVVRNWIVVDDGAVQPIEKGANALGVGIVNADENIEIDSEVIVLTSSKKAIAVGHAKKTGTQMIGRRGVGVKTRWYGSCEDMILPSGQIWDDVISANSWFFERKIPRAL